MSKILIILLCSLLISTMSGGQAAMNVPEDFPRFQVPGQEDKMESLRALFWLHYPGAGPKSTLWDEWLSSPGLWPAVDTEGSADRMRQQWSRELSSRIIDPEGYVATHQHASIAHQLGWPFPFWNQGRGGYGWHFSYKDTVGPPWRGNELSTQEDWQVRGAQDKGIVEDGWSLELTEPNATVRTPERVIDTFQSPFIQLRWRAEGLGNAQPYIEWISKDLPRFSPERRFYFEPIESPDRTVFTMIPVYRHPDWKGEITGLRLGFGNRQTGGNVTIQALFTQYDTRHNINSQNFIRGCANYFWWTRDINFLRDNINRMRTALRYMMTEHETLERKVVYTPWVGHDGRSGLRRESPDKPAQILSGHGIGNNYWDLLPFGHLDAYATMHYYDALKHLARIEREIEANPGWNIPEGVLKMEPDALLKHAAEVKAEGSRLFWNRETGRFAAGVDADGNKPDYGLTFLNLEAIYYDFATPEQARSIMSWISGERIVKGDTSQGADIYNWRFGPRATTKRNIDYYGWYWSAPETIPWGGQVQDGGGVLGFSYHDLMSRLKMRGPDDAWNRLKEIIAWFDEVQAAGGYRKFYDGTREGTLQGGGPPGGLGMDQEFFESVLVLQLVIDGFLGFSPTADGFKINPRLPNDWPELTVDRIRLHDLVLQVKATSEAIEIRKEGDADEPHYVHLPEGDWTMAYIGRDGRIRAAQIPVRRASDGAVEINWIGVEGVCFER